jgi:predicted AlkP superfamily pyrophosphatase or phosphodiesterase
MKNLRILLVVALAAALVATLLVVIPRRNAEGTRLVVLLVFDQLRGDYPSRWQSKFGPDGFKRLQTEGAWFSNCHYPYANTVTAAGHASLSTGCSPYRHGMVGNSWYDRASKRTVNAEGDPKVRQVPAPPNPPKDETKLGVSSRLRLQPTVGDVLKETNGKAKVVSISLKPRSASLLAGLIADLVYWFSNLTGGFVTSTHYRDAPHEWVRRFNSEHLADRWFGQTWDRDQGSLDYDSLAGPDDVPGEGKSQGFGRTFPHVIAGTKKKLGPEYYDALAATPMGNDLVLRFAKAAIDEERLGQRDAADLLLISFSSNDPIGHIFGPDSHEVLDVTLRTDKLIADFLHHLDAKIGKNHYAVVVTADHGICPLPEVALKQGKDAGRIVPDNLKKEAEGFLQDAFGKSDRAYIEEFVSPWFYLDYKTLAMQNVSQADAEQKLAHWLTRQAGVESAFTRTELLKRMPTDAVGESVWRSYHPDRCGDVVLAPLPYFFVSSYSGGTTHGSPHDYDTHVPLFVFGPGIRPGVYEERITPQATAAILSHFLQISPPAGSEAPMPDSLTR